MLKADRLCRAAFLLFKISLGPSNFCALKLPPTGEFVAARKPIPWIF
jgi:hypothetical protein